MQEQAEIDELRLKLKQGLIKKSSLSPEILKKIGSIYPKAHGKKKVAKQGTKKREDGSKQSDSKEKKIADSPGPKKTGLKVSTEKQQTNTN